MSRIIYSGSGVQFENVSFHDLESCGKEKGFFFVSKPMAEPENIKIGADAVSETSAGKKEPLKEPPIDLEAIREEAYSKGKKAGRLEAEGEMHTAAQALARGLEQISRLRESLLARSKEDMVRLVMGVVKRVIQTEVVEKEDIILKTVIRALKAAVESDEYYIKVHPEDLKKVAENEPLFLAAMKGLQNIHFISDESITRGGCLAESRAGDVDATIDSQLNEIYEHLRNEILS